MVFLPKRGVLMTIYIELNRKLESSSRGTIWYAYSKQLNPDYSAFISYETHISALNDLQDKIDGLIEELTIAKKELLLKDNK